jgi:hypothetical protein
MSLVFDNFCQGKCHSSLSFKLVLLNIKGKAKNNRRFILASFSIQCEECRLPSGCIRTTDSKCKLAAHYEIDADALTPGKVVERIIQI